MAQAAQLRVIDNPASEAQRIFLLQKAAYRKQPFPSYAQRVVNLNKLEKMLLDNTDAITATISADFGHRSATETKMVEMFGNLSAIRDARRHLKKWMKPQKRRTSIMFATGKNRLIPQPKGIIGIGTPWNYPLYLSIGPIICALAAGNRCMIKLAANSQNLCRLLQMLCAEIFGDDTVAYLPGVGGSEFTALPFDHIVYTGSAESGKTVMKSAAENLCPVTLELGGKSPTVICDDYNLEEAARRLLYTKYLNAGQTCVAPDYLFLPEGKVDAFVKFASEVVSERYPDTNDESYTSVIDAHSFNRLKETLDDAVVKGARAVNLTGNDFNAELKKFPPHIVVNPSNEMTLMQEEIFGPILPIMTYQSIDDVLTYINDRDRPLALYIFTNDKNIQEQMLYETMSGGVTINHCVFHVLQHDIPFGGVGASGMGHYHGFEGFLELSKLRPVFTFPKVGKPDLFYPPYTSFHEKLFNMLNRLKL
ncbi:MAG: coniferyl aldehyde dehydrogenase [Porticoccaceae bacterium]|nr:coniferyl aldehyde dehydrogenase [Porticoccaceae bacterium]